MADILPGGDGSANPWWIIYGTPNGGIGSIRADKAGIRIDSEYWPWPLLTNIDGSFMKGPFIAWPGTSRWGDTTILPTATQTIKLPGSSYVVTSLAVVPALTLIQAPTSYAAIDLFENPAEVGLLLGRPGGFACYQSFVEWKAVNGALGNEDSGQIWCGFKNAAGAEAVQDVHDRRFVRNGGGIYAGHWFDVNGNVDLGFCIGGASKPEHGFAGAIQDAEGLASAAFQDLESNPLGAFLLGVVVVSSGGALTLVAGAVEAGATVATLGAAGLDAAGITHGALGDVGQVGKFVATHPAEIGEGIAGAELLAAGAFAAPAIGGAAGAAVGTVAAAGGKAAIGGSLGSVANQRAREAALAGEQTAGTNNPASERQALGKAGGVYWWRVFNLKGRKNV